MDEKDTKIKHLEDALNHADDEVARLHGLVQRMTCRCLFKQLYHDDDCPLLEIEFDNEPEISYS